MARLRARAQACYRRRTVVGFALGMTVLASGSTIASAAQTRLQAVWPASAPAVAAMPHPHASEQPFAHAARYCGQLQHHGLRASLPLDARGVSCARARALVTAWDRTARSAERRGSACVPAEGGGPPSRTCGVEGWRCIAGHSREGATVPVACARERKRVTFKVPL